MRHRLPQLQYASAHCEVVDCLILQFFCELNLVYFFMASDELFAVSQVKDSSVKNSDIKILAYSRSEGSENYRSKLAQYYSKKNISVNLNDKYTKHYS